jgi:transposase-like protein/IS1 family transposase
VVCHNCQSRCKKFGRHRNGLQRYRCKQCSKTFTEDHATPLRGMYTPLDKAAKAVELLCEGCSVGTVERITGLNRRTILSLLTLSGEKCERLLERRIQRLPVKDVQADEIWGFVGCKEKHNYTGNPEFGDAYCFVGIERNTKLVLTWHLGRRSAYDTAVFTEKLNAATAGEFQITTDGFAPYVDSVLTSLGTRVSFAQLIKVYAANPDEHRYSPPRVIEAVAKPIWGNPDPERICTSHVERSNGTMRTNIRRLTRLTYAFSKKRGESASGLGAVFRLVQLLPCHSYPSSNSGNAGRNQRPHLDDHRTVGGRVTLWPTWIRPPPFRDCRRQASGNRPLCTVPLACHSTSTTPQLSQKPITFKSGDPLLRCTTLATFGLLFTGVAPHFQRRIYV